MESSNVGQSNNKDIGLEARLKNLRVNPPHLDGLFLNPIMRGYIRYEQLRDGSITFYDILLLNHIISYKDLVENTVNKYYEEQREKNARRRY